MRKRKKRPARRRRGVIWFVLKTVTLVILTTVVATLALRWVHPWTTSFMMQRRLSAWWTSAKYEQHYHWVGWSDIAPHAAVAVVAAEDQKFADHVGFDVESIADALEERERGERLRGASTISQQVAKNLFLWPGRSFVRKGLEAYFTVLIEALWPKRRILETYLNIAEFGNGVFGVDAASQRFFGKPASKLEPSEAALLAAVLPNPNRLHVERPSTYVERRRAWILRQMDQLGGVGYVKQF